MCTDVRKVEPKRKCVCVIVCEYVEKVEWGENGHNRSIIRKILSVIY